MRPLWGTVAVPADPFNLHAISSLISSLAVFITALASLIVARKTRSEVKEVHGIVNSTSQVKDARINQLTQSITDAGNVVPEEI